MFKRSNSLLRFIEAGAVGWFLVQAARFLIMWVFARSSGAEIAARIYGPGAPLIGTAALELVTVAAGALVPLLGAILQRWRLTATAAVALAAVGHVMMVTDAPTVQIVSAAAVLGAGGLYFAMLARHWADFFPLGLLTGLAADQIVRAWGNTRDFSLAAPYLTAQTIVSIVTLGVGILTWLTLEEEAAADEPDREEAEPQPSADRKGRIGFWNSLALGGLLFLELALLALPTAAARVTGVGYAVLLPWMVGATVLPAIPAVRGAARRFISLFDGTVRGWIWFLLLGLCLVLGLRLGGLIGATGLVIAQVLAVLALWWVIEPARQRNRGTTGPGIALAWGVFGMFAVGNLFTFVYGAPDPATTPAFLVTIIGAFRGMGWLLFGAAALLGCLPAIGARVRIPWRDGSRLVTLGLLILGVGAVGAAVYPYLQQLTAQSIPADVAQIRIATFNIHSGYSPLYEPSLDEVERIIRETSVDIVLLQEVDTGRLTSNGVDQAWWLARRLRMQLAYYPTNESVYGLAILTRVPLIAGSMEGSPLTSEGEQTSAQRLQVCTELIGTGQNCPPEKTIDVYNTWLGRPERDTPPHEMDQWIQMSELLRWMQQNTAGAVEPWVVVGGTFNATPDSLLYDQMLIYNYEDPFEVLMLPPDETATFCPGPCLARWDYIWLHNLSPQVAAVIETPNASDHRMPVVEVNLKPEEGTEE